MPHPQRQQKRTVHAAGRIEYFKEELKTAGITGKSTVHAI